MKKTYLNPAWNLIVNNIGSMVICMNRIRRYLYNFSGMEIHKSIIRPGCFFYGNKIKVGNGSFVNNGCYFYNVEQIHIGENVFLAPQVMLGTNGHEIGNSNLRAGKMVSDPINIGSGSWIGARAIILPGVNIGDGCVIASGAVVTKDCEPNYLYAGVPAKKIKELPDGNKVKAVI